MPDADLGLPSGALEPRDLLVHLRQWLLSHKESHTRHFGESDYSGHPHGYAGVVIPDWDVRQRLDEIEAAIQLRSGCSCQPGRCMAPRIMGRQMPCLDPEKASADGTDRSLSTEAE